MKKIFIIIAAVILMLGVSGCVSISVTTDTATLSPDNTAGSVVQDAQNKVNLANARNIATAINAYNALNPDDILPDNVTLEQAKEALDNLWPTGLTGEQAGAAWELIEIKSGVADIKE